jgi:hypothetical protein
LSVRAPKETGTTFAEDFHANNVGVLLRNIDLAHVNLHGDAEVRARRRKGYA